MTDIALRYKPEKGYFDIAIEDGDLAKDDGLETAFILSFFLDRRANDDDDIPDGTTDKRGWHGDAYATVTGDRIGSRLWLLGRSKQTADTLSLAKDYLQESAQWSIEDGVAESVEAECSYPRDGMLFVSVSGTRADDPASPWRHQWEVQLNND